MIHSNSLKDTKLWQVYYEKCKGDIKRIEWTQEVYTMACENLKAVRDVFKNYTLHDEKHVLNVLDAMAGLLGNRINDLTVGEAELLILASSLHDVGMIYTEQEKYNCFSNLYRLQEFYALYPELKNVDLEDWSELEKQNYLRWLHPYRIVDILQRSEWRNVFDERPNEVVPEDVIVAVCRAHGETPEQLRRETTENNGELKYLRFKDVDPLFCAILLRLADILDFDDSRAPAILFSYAEKSPKSVEEWQKHMASMGFNYPSEPCSDKLPFGAYFTDPNIERSTNVFLDWIDGELINSQSLLFLTCDRWKSFPFPFQVDRSEVERKGYDYGDFKITMDQRQIMDLLIGENLYHNRSDFIRELLQNSIDATLIRAEMEPSFAEKINTDEARIDLWEWWDDNGELWFRIDDFGSGMTKGMLSKYFLKAGNSYYNSRELIRDLNGKTFSSISRFGIGFLSSFLCGDEAYVSTTYWNPEKNIKEEFNGEERNNKRGFGLRLDVLGVNGYYTLRNQNIIDNKPESMPTPPLSMPHPQLNYEKDGYRTKPGTSIAIRLDAGKLGAGSLLEEVKKWTCFPPMPIYYNGKRLCITQSELLALATEESGSFEYELSDEEKRQFDEFIPEFKGRYPIIRENIDYFDAERIPGLTKQKIFFFETMVLMKNEKYVVRGGHKYRITGVSNFGKPQITIEGAGKDDSDLILSLKSKDRRKLIDILSDNISYKGLMHYGWKGIFAYHDGPGVYDASPFMLIIDEDDARPELMVNRDYLLSAPLKTMTVTFAWLEKCYPYLRRGYGLADFSRANYKKWREVLSDSFLRWLDITSMDSFNKFKEAYEKLLSYNGMYPRIINDDSSEGSKYFWSCVGRHNDFRYVFLAYMQLHYRVTINFADKKISMKEIAIDEEIIKFDLFPTMFFVYGEKEEDRSIICSATRRHRMFIVADHPFISWLLDNAEILNKYYPRQFGQIVSVLKYGEAYKVVEVANQVIFQISKNAFKYGINISECQKISLDDFLN